MPDNRGRARVAQAHAARHLPRRRHPLRTRDAAICRATNYSSAKLGLEAFKRRVKALRSSLLVPRLFEPIWRRWVLLEILIGRLHAPDFARDPEPYFAVSFLFTEWAALDPH